MSLLDLNSYCRGTLPAMNLFFFMANVADVSGHRALLNGALPAFHVLLSFLWLRITMKAVAASSRAARDTGRSLHFLPFEIRMQTIKLSSSACEHFDRCLRSRPARCSRTAWSRALTSVPRISSSKLQPMQILPIFTCSSYFPHVNGRSMSSLDRPLQAAAIAPS